MKSSLLSFFVLLLVSAASGQEWVRTRDGAYGFAMAMDSLGRVCIAGPSAGIPEDIVVCKYDSDGTKLWETVYDSPYHGREYCYDMEIDALGNSYLTGLSDTDTRRYMLTLALDSLGHLKWDDYFITPDSGACWGIAMTMDCRGKLYVAARISGNDYDIGIFRYDTSGAREWMASYNGPGNDWDDPWDIVVDANSNTYVCAESRGTGGDADCVTLKCDSSGSITWVQRFDGPAHQNDQGVQLELGPSGALAVAVQGSGLGTASDWFTVMYDTAGNEQWVRQYDGGVGSYDSPYDLAFDREGNVLVAGGAHLVSGFDFVTIKYTADGDTAWIRPFGLNPHYSGTEHRLIIVDSLGYAFTSGEYVADDSCGWLTTMLDPTGQVCWHHTYAVEPPYAGTPYGLLLDRAGCLYVGGGMTFGEEQVLIKYANPRAGLASAPRVSSPTRSTNGASVFRCMPGEVAFDALGRKVAHARPGVYFILDPTHTRRILLVK